MDILDKITKNFNNSSYNWLPHVVFISFLVIAMLIGFIMARRTAIYFGIGILFSVIISIIITVFLIKFSYAKFVPKDLKIGLVTYEKLFDTNKLYLQAILFFPVFIFTTILVVLLQLMLFFILRKKVFKNRIISLKENKNSTLIFRFHGLLISFVFMLPFALITTSYIATMASGSSSLFYSKTVNVITLGQVNSPTQKIRELMLVTNSASILIRNAGAIKTILGDPKGDHHGILDLLTREDGRNALKTIILSRFVNNNIAILTGQITPEQIANIDLSGSTPDVSWIPQISKDYSVKVPSDALDMFSKSVAENLKKAGAKISPEGLRYLLIHTNIISI